MYSMPKPTFKSLMRFSLASPRCEYHSIVTAASRSGDCWQWRDSDRATCPRTNPAPAQDDQSERLVGLVHAMDRFGDFSISKRLPLAFRNGRDHGLDRRVLIRPDRKDLVGFLAIIEDIRLIRCTVGAHGLDPPALGHLAFAGLHELQVPGRRSRIAFSEFVVDDQTVFRDMPHHRHVTLLALIAVTSLTLFRHDLRRIDVEREVRALVGAQQTAEHAAVYTLQPRQPSALVGAHASHPIATGVAARHIIQADNTTQSVVTA